MYMCMYNMESKYIHICIYLLSILYIHIHTVTMQSFLQVYAGKVCEVRTKYTGCVNLCKCTHV